MEEYEEAGRKHIDKDLEVGVEFMNDNQRRINGHISMLLKTFMVGANWGHEGRHRATKITHSLSVAPLYLLFKDHKGWSVDMGTPPPTRPVASAGKGQNDHLSETVSQVLEPVANLYEGGMEVNSTQDLLSRIDELNDGKNLELENIDFSEVNRELDELEEERHVMEEKTRQEVAQEETESPLEGEQIKLQGTSSRAGNMRKIREAIHIKRSKRNVDMFKPVDGDIEVQKITRRALSKRGQSKLIASELENKLVQDKSRNMVIVGADVEALYPSLEDAL